MVVWHAGQRIARILSSICVLVLGICQQLVFTGRAMSDWLPDFIAWHERRMVECGYGPRIVEMLRRDRERWIAGMR